MAKYIMALDQGTTSSRAVLFDRKLNMVDMAQRELTQIYPREGWVEHDPMEIWSGQYSVMMELIARSGITPEDIACIGITNQRETTILWDKNTGRPVYNAIVWQCRRTAPMIDALSEQGYGEEIQKRTGLIPDAYFSASKIKWILEHVPGVREQAQKGEILFGTVDSWLVWKLTEGRAHVTDRTNASRTMLYNIETLEWDRYLLDMLQIPPDILPEVKDSAALFGYANVGGVQIPITGIAGDQQAALFGQCCFEAGQAKNTYGTGCFLLTNTGTSLCRSKHGLLSTVGISLNGKIQYALEGSVFAGGAVIQWLRDGLRIIDESRDAEYYARKVPDNGGVYIVPAFTGLGAPYWDMYARGTVTGVTRGTSREHIIRAAEEAIAYQSADLVLAMEQDTGFPITELKVDGGASRDGFLLQFQSDILNKKVIRSGTGETTALGVACLAGLAEGIFADLDEVKALWKADRTFVPQMQEEHRRGLMEKWHRAVSRSRNWESE
jgi:glycerol kinase